jgi:hypothetical protein
MDKFLDYDRIKESKEGPIVVKCYYNGIKWVCPDPKNKKLCDNVQNWYMSSRNIDCIEILISDELYIQAIGK